MFQDRTDAGRQLSDLLDDRDVEADVVLAIPRGGLPVARPVADALGAPLDVVVASKIGAPNNPELAIGAVASDGSLWRNENLIDRLGVEDAYVERERDSEAAAAREKLERYRGTADLPDVAEKRVVVVDDGLATGATTIAALRQVRAAGASHVVLAVPVGSPDSVERLRTEVDDVIAIETPPHFSAVGQFYRSFDQVTDEQAMAYLED
ncbi:phosphoribosyltransferase [Halorussus caseinilyticus]|uniref:Phosphoribosyltransferase n=1 Tax=Halorussus caseinilyticus TaxID=3034025 RepID=A0ABD5WMG7_9EURY|nr:phosphoribosyltransferase family protein [Halorussus sp. DT72]